MTRPIKICLYSQKGSENSERKEKQMAKLHFTYGVMAASKSADLCIQAYNLRKAGNKYEAIKPEKDNRDSDNEIRPRIKGLHEPSLVLKDFDNYQPKSDTNSNYYHYLFRTKRFNGECYRYGRGIMMMRWRTYSTEFSSISIPVPPIEEQQQIADYLDKKCEQIDRLIAIKQQKIEKIQQYKKSIIYEYVTGKKEV